ncbi:MAG: HU family DNA-binding protein [Bacteroidales bacterium]|nr:HU family DNA-binding protein [Bacteroidales bacterium]MDY5921566.1 HU family DNA-binding protein [Candidatus Onthomorpha sp.]MCI6800449.1 HU family DNA-binding protein [Bacteroidales bacterium]MCI6963106.1 HU family DNA-binding protein [Bacteroidales bacterium]MDD5976786.1 HU family DNA-binding protein [Bacteroidales bacterium]
MAINYVKVKRNLTVGSNPGERFLARIFRTGNDVTLEQLAENISEASTLSSADILAALKALESQIAKSVLNGQTVRLGYLGSFVPSIEAKAVNTVDEVTADSIMRARCRFVPSPIFKNKLKNCKFTLANLDIAGLQ